MPGGRPTKLEQTVRTRDDGSPVTAGAEFIERIRLGLPHDQACASANVARNTVLGWRQKGGAALAKLARGERVTKNERVYAEFVTTLERAEADAETSRLGVIERAARGGTTVTETHETSTRVADAQAPGGARMVVTERRTVTKTLAPQWQAAAWWLERRIPHRYARRFEVSGPNGGPIPVEDRARELSDAVRDFLAGAEAARDVDERSNGSAKHD